MKKIVKNSKLHVPITTVLIFKEKFPHLEFYAFELKKSDHIPEESALHLDCCFQPIGENKAIISPEGFRNKSDVNELIKLFGDDNVLLVTSKEMSNMYTNVFPLVRISLFQIPDSFD